MNPAQNYNVYRSHLHSCVPPLLPYLGQYLTDLTMIQEGNPDMKDGLINFHKRTLLYKIMAEVELFQVTPYGFQTDPVLCANLLLIVPHPDQQIFDNECFEQSLIREPRRTETKKTLM